MDGLTELLTMAWQGIWATVADWGPGWVTAWATVGLVVVGALALVHRRQSNSVTARIPLVDGGYVESRAGTGGEAVAQLAEFFDGLLDDPKLAPLLSQAQQDRAAGRPELAADALGAGLQARPSPSEQVALLITRGNASYEAKRLDAAANDWLRALEVAPAIENASERTVALSVAHYNYAILLDDTGRPEEAEGHYKEALRLRPDFSKAHYNYAMLLLHTGRLWDMLDHMRQALQLFHKRGKQANGISSDATWRRWRPKSMPVHRGKHLARRQVDGEWATRSVCSRSLS